MNTLCIMSCKLASLAPILSIILCVYIVIFMNNICKYLFGKNEISKYNIDINCTIKQSEVDEELDSFIRGRWEEYYICKLGWKNINNVTQQEQEQIMLELADTIHNTISPVLLTRLSRFYNTTKNKNGVSGLDQVIADKIQFIVLNYSIETNRLKNK